MNLTNFIAKSQLLIVPIPGPVVWWAFTRPLGPVVRNLITLLVNVSLKF